MLLVIRILAGSALQLNVQEKYFTIRVWVITLNWTYSAISTVVNALVTGLIVFRIFKVFREIKTTVDDRILGRTGGRKLRRIIFVLTESGMLLFSIQIVQQLLFLAKTDAAIDAYALIDGLNQLQMVNVIIISIITTLNFTDKIFLF